MPEEFYEKRHMEKDLGSEVEPYTPAEIDEMHEAMKTKAAIQAYIRKIRIPWQFEWEG